MNWVFIMNLIKSPSLPAFYPFCTVIHYIAAGWSTEREYPL